MGEEGEGAAATILADLSCALQPLALPPSCISSRSRLAQFGSLIRPLTLVLCPTVAPSLACLVAIIAGKRVWMWAFFSSHRSTGRNCGRLVCSSCSKTCMPLKHLGYCEPQRVCDAC